MRKLGLTMGLAALLSLCIGCGQATVGLSPSIRDQAIVAKATDGAYRLHIGPDNAEAPILSAIKGAQKTIDLSVYLLSNERVIAALTEAAGRGIVTRVILERNPFNPETPDEPLQTNRDSATTLLKGGVRVGWSDPAFRFNHSKYMIVDGAEAFVSTGNFTNSGLTKNRDLIVQVHEPSDVKELVKIYEGDWTHVYHTTKDPNLVVSPYNSRTKLMGMIAKAKKSVRISMECFGDEYAIQDLIARSQKLDIQVLLAEPGRISSNADTAKKLMTGKVKVRYQIAPFLHAKTIQIDGQEVYIGSINLTKNSMDGNREIGLLVNDTTINSQMDALWKSDWSKAVEPSKYQPAPQENP